MKLKKVMVGVSVLAMTLALAAPVAAMPGDVKGKNPEDISHRAGGASTNPEDISNRAGGASADDFERIDAYYTCTGTANVREFPNGPVVGSVVYGESYYVVGREPNGWYEIDGFGGPAYVYEDFMEPQAEEDISHRAGGASEEEEDEYELMSKLDMMMVASEDVNMREYPNGPIVDVLKKGSEIHVLGNLDKVLWYQCKTKDGEIVYIYDDYLRPEFPQTMMATHVLNVRELPSTGSPVVHVLDIGDKVKVSAIEGGWYKFTYNDKGDVGYSHADYMVAVEK